MRLSSLFINNATLFFTITHIPTLCNIAHWYFVLEISQHYKDLTRFFPEIIFPQLNKDDRYFVNLSVTKKQHVDNTLFDFYCHREHIHLLEEPEF